MKFARKLFRFLVALTFIGSLIGSSTLLESKHQQTLKSTGSLKKVGNSSSIDVAMHFEVCGGPNS